MKKLVLIIVVLIGYNVSYSQAYKVPNFVEPDYITVSSNEGIIVSSITPNQDKSYEVVLYNNNRPNPGEIATYNFEWYLSYKGKRVSDYYQGSVRCCSSATRKVFCWPGEVPAGHEMYVTVQFGREPAKRDPRDDD